jgi:glycogen synthase
LIEAMAAGCVPVASCIRGVTDAIIRPTENGFLFPIGDISAAAAIIRELERDRPTLERMSDAARRSARDRFSIERMASQYADILRQAQAAPAATARPLPLHRWRYPWALRPGLRTFLPKPVKKTLRLWRERLAA